METPAFDNCLRIFDSWDKDGGSVIAELNSHPEYFPDKYVKPFKRELYKRIVDKQEPSYRRDLIKFYIEELTTTANLIEKFFDIEPIPIYDENNELAMFLTDGTVSLKPVFDKRIVLLYTSILEVIQYCCNSYNIPFVEICSEIEFPIGTIHYAIPGTQRYYQNQTSVPAKDIPPVNQNVIVIESEDIEQIYTVLKAYFSENHQIKLLNLLNGERISEKLIFLETGSSLADAFKQLIDSKIIKCCQKKDLESWIADNFQYRYRDEIKNFRLRYLHDIISTNKEKTKKPIIDVERNHASGMRKIKKV